MVLVHHLDALHLVLARNLLALVGEGGPLVVVEKATHVLPNLDRVVVLVPPFQQIPGLVALPFAPRLDVEEIVDLLALVPQEEVDTVALLAEEVDTGALDVAPRVEVVDIVAVA